jgi:hypothetical protein
MRRLVFTLLCGLVVVPTALAGARATGDGVLELNEVYGTVQIGTNLQPARGVLWGQMKSGRLKVLDPVVGDGRVLVSGEDHTVTSLTPDGLKVVTYSGRDLHFRVTGGKYKLVFIGTGIDLTAVGVGVARLSGDDTAFYAGDYALDSGDWTPVPVFTDPTDSQRVAFGTPTAAAATP